MARLLSLNVGLPSEVTWNGKTVRTAIWKFPVEGRRMVRKLNVDGDAQADLAGHGGEQRAVFVYQMESYDYWKRFLGRNDFIFGQFGENFTVEGLADDEVYIGDRYRIGDAMFEVTQPRVTCYRVGIRMNEPRMPALLVAHHRPGFYFRVLQEGEVGAGDDIVKVAHGPEQLTVAHIDALLYLPGHSREDVVRALRVPALSKGWQASFQAILQQGSNAKTDAGNPGLANEEQAPAWPGFKQMRVTDIRKESESVTSFLLVSMEGQDIPIPQPGQFVVLRLQVDPDKPPILRSYSLSDLPASDHFRISVKNESTGIGSSFSVHSRTSGRCPGGQRTTWQLYLATWRESPRSVKRWRWCNAGDGNAARTCRRKITTTGLVDLWSARWRQSSIRGRSTFSVKPARTRTKHIVYSRPAPTDRLEMDFDGSGHIDTALLERIGVPRNCDFYLCGPSSFLQNMRDGLRKWDVLAENIHMEVFGALESIKPGLKQMDHSPHLPQGPQGSGPAVFLRTQWDHRRVGL